jgi:DNA polymerase (family 10)
MANQPYADRLEEIAALLQVTDANPFKVRAFQNAARIVSKLDTPLETLLDEGRILEVDGIGRSIAQDLQALRDTGTCPVLEALRAELPAGIPDLLRVQGLGPKKVRRLWTELGIGDLDTLEAMAGQGHLASLDGFGARTEEKILAEIARLRASAGRHPLARVVVPAATLLAFLQALPGVEEATLAGSFRRGRETVKDLDLVVAAREPGPIMQAFVTHPLVQEVVAHGDTKSSVYLRDGLPVDLRVVPPEVFGATLHHFTGSREHNVAMRARALQRGLRVSEWGVFRRDDEGREHPIACRHEADIFAAVGLPFIPPELREGLGEIERAEAGTLPDLIDATHILGDLHMHTVDSDGSHDLDAMARAARARGLTHIAITDHSRSLTVARGLSRERLLDQIDRIDAWNAAHAELGVRILRGLEVDILEEGALDMDDDVLDRLDWVVGSVHSRMNQPADVMTERLVKAVRSGRISALGHPTGRLIGQRDPYGFDHAAVFDACQAMGVALEVNAAPERLDLGPELLALALQRPGLWITINTDAHHTDGLDAMAFGVRTARRGMVPRDRVLNALPLEAFLAARRAPGSAA